MALRLALDSNRYTDYAKGDPATKHVLYTAEFIAFPFIVIGELRGGFRAGVHNLENEKKLTEFLQLRFVSILYPDNDTTHLYATIYSDLRARGKPIPSNDMWIAALVMQHGLSLCSRDRHFEDMPIPLIR
jgi:predicted nucleic acid-binding protein